MNNRRLPRPFATVVAVGLGIIGTSLAALWLLPTLQASNQDASLVSSFTPYGLIAWLLATIVLFSSGRGLGRLVALIPLAALFANAVILVPYYDISYQAPSGTNPTLRVMSLNLHYGQADTGQLLAKVNQEKPDLLILTEFTTQNEAMFTDPAWQQLLPYHLGASGRASYNRFNGDSSGTQVLSRVPITELGRTVGTTATNISVSLEIDGRRLVLIAAHPVNPVRGKVDGWLSDAQILTDFTRNYNQQPLVVVGDLNSVPEHLTVQNLLTANRLHQTVQGWQPTFPTDRLFPLITIDHVLASAEFATVSVSRFKVSNTDHLGTVVELAQS